MPQRIRLAFAQAFASFPEYAFLWKYDSMPDDDVVFSGVRNVFRFKWLPQRDLLGDGFSNSQISSLQIKIPQEYIFTLDDECLLNLTGTQISNVVTKINWFILLHENQKFQLAAYIKTASVHALDLKFCSLLYLIIMDRHKFTTPDYLCFIVNERFCAYTIAVDNSDEDQHD